MSNVVQTDMLKCTCNAENLKREANGKRKAFKLNKETQDQENVHPSSQGAASHKKSRIYKKPTAKEGIKKVAVKKEKIRNPKNCVEKCQPGKA